jgi:hypothetical protein
MMDKRQALKTPSAASSLEVTNRGRVKEKFSPRERYSSSNSYSFLVTMSINYTVGKYARGVALLPYR